MSTRVINPFLNRNKVTDPKEFFGRRKEIDYTIDNLTYPEPQSVAVIGERRSGKSSLLTRLYQLLSRKEYARWRDALPERERDVWEEIHNRIKSYEKFVCILLDAEEITTATGEHFSWVVIDELVSEDQTLLDYVQCYPTACDEKNMPPRHPQIILKNLLKEACAAGYRFVFLIDEFELLARNEKLLEANYLHYLRGISDNCALAFVTTSRKPLSEISYVADPHGSPFDNNFSKSLHLGLLEENECRELVEGVLENCGCKPTTFRSTEVEDAIKLAGKQPYFLKIACSHLFNWVTEGRLERDKKPWRDKFEDEAKEEFSRIWEVLDEEERDWVLTAQQSANIGSKEIDMTQSLKLLIKKGLLEKEAEKSSVVLFSTGFSDFISDYVKALENDYKDTERQIREGYVKLNSESVKSILAHLTRLKAEWKRREKKSILIEKTFTNCERLSVIFKGFVTLFEAVRDYEKSESARSSKAVARSRKVEKALNNLAGYFEKHQWFGESGGEDISMYTGKRMLDQLIEYLDQQDKQRIFGNGYDRILAARINFMKNHGWEKFNKFTDEVQHAFDRLIEVNDYVRANEILQLKQNPAIEWLSKKFLRNPLTTVGAIILVPFVLVNFLVLKVTFFENGAGYLWGAVLVFHIYLIWTMYKPMISERFCGLPNSRKLYKKLVFYRTFFLTIVGFFAFMAVLGSVAEAPKEIGENPYPILAIGCLVGVVSFFVVVASIKPKVQSVWVAFRRGSYFCSVEYLKAFWIVMGVSVLCYIISIQFPSVVGRFMVMEQIAKDSDETWYFPNKIEILRMGFNFPVVIALSFLAPVAGAWKFIKEALS